jgi:hypothetical protein
MANFYAIPSLLGAWFCVSYYDRETFFHRRHIAASPATLTDAERERVRQALRPFLTEDGELAYLSGEE